MHWKESDMCADVENEGSDVPEIAYINVGEKACSIRFEFCIENWAVDGRDCTVILRTRKVGSLAQNMASPLLYLCNLYIQT